MTFIKKYLWIVFICFYSSFLMACPCFNRGFLHSEFQKNKNTKCHIYMNGDIIYKIEMANEQQTASSTHTTCLLNTGYHDVSVDYGMFYRNNHSDCIDEVLAACKQLKQNTYIRDE